MGSTKKCVWASPNSSWMGKWAVGGKKYAGGIFAFRVRLKKKPAKKYIGNQLGLKRTKTINFGGKLSFSIWHSVAAAFHTEI
jgi:hypothetical protein